MQVYVAAVDEERKKTRENAKARGERESRTGRQRGGRNVSPLRADPGFNGKEREGRRERTRDFTRNRQPSLEATDTAAAATTTGETLEHKPGENEELAPTTTAAAVGSRLLWLFPKSSEEGGRRAFNRHAVCGGAVHALITLESAAAIVRDAGKVFPVELAWRWCPESSKDGTPRGGHLLGFQTFIEMCEGLKDHMSNVSIMSQEDCCTPATTAAATAVPVQVAKTKGLT